MLWQICRCSLLPLLLLLVLLLLLSLNSTRAFLRNSVHDQHNRYATAAAIGCPAS